MIEEFNFGNFWSFKEMQTLNMTAAKIKSKNSMLDKTNVFAVNNELSLIKSKAIYGANASGKSNVIRALSAFIRIVIDSAKEENTLNLIDSFQLSTETISQPTLFQLIFRLGKTRYRYGFEADEKSIKSEWLFSTPKVREQALFIREKNEIIEINQTYFTEGILYQKLLEGSKDQIFTETSLFLTHLNSIGFAKLSKEIFKIISSITVISGLEHSGMYNIAEDALRDSIKKKFILDLLKRADVGIEDLERVDIQTEYLPDNAEKEVQQKFKKGKIIVSSRTQYDSNLIPAGKSEFYFRNQESAGTKKMFELSPFIYKSLKDGAPLIIDEFDCRFHPSLTKKIVGLFNSPENKNAQLIFTTNDTNLLSSDLLRRDQIDFVEKDKYGASHLYTLAEIKGVRNDAAFKNDYLQGKYGAIPFLSDFTNLISFE